MQCVKIKLKPNSLKRVREWAAELNRRRDEALATLEDESIVVETFFLDSSGADDYLIGYVRASSLVQAEEAVKRSTHAIDAYHQQFKRDTWASGKQLELLLDLERRSHRGAKG